MGVVSKVRGIFMRDRMLVSNQSSFAGLNVSSLARLWDLTVQGSLYAGIVAVASNAVFAVVSTSAVLSNSIITAQVLSEQASAQAQNSGVSSRVDGVSFAVSLRPALEDQETNVCWRIHR